MASSIYYKFKSQKDESKITFDGIGISVADLKKEIIIANNLKANDFELLLFDPSADQEYKEDSVIIPRSSSVIAKRVPARPGKVSSRFGLRSIEGSANKQQISKTPILAASVSSTDEAAAMAAMFKAQTDVWEETQKKMSHAVPVYNQRGSIRGGKPFTGRLTHQPERSLPTSYVCYRCGQKGHWIQDCPTNNDREFDNRPRLKRTTGIPRSFLKAVESPSEGKALQGIMVTPDGGYVVAQPDSASWQKQVSRAKDQKEDTNSKEDIEVQFDHHPGANFDINQIVEETIPQLQAQISQLNIMLHNSSLPTPVRQSTMQQLQQYQLQLQQAQAFVTLAADMNAAASAAAAAVAQQNVGSIEQGFSQNHWPTPFPNQQPAGQESAYQRLPVGSRQRSSKRERPSDFLEIGTGEPQTKMPRYWE